MNGTFLWPSTPGEQAHCQLLQGKCTNVLKQAWGVCVPSFLAISLGCTSKLGCQLGHKPQFGPPTTAKNVTLYRLSTPMVLLKLKKFMWRWPRNRFGTAWVAATVTILILAWGEVEGQRKLTKVAATGVLRGLVPRGPTENASSQSIMKVRSWFLDQIEAGMKLHPVEPSVIENSRFWWSSCIQKRKQSAKNAYCHWGAAITAKIYCPTHCFWAQRDRTGLRSSYLPSNECHVLSLEGLVLGLIMLKPPWTVPFCSPPPQGQEELWKECFFIAVENLERCQQVRMPHHHCDGIDHSPLILILHG